MLAEVVREHGELGGGNLNRGERSSRQALYIGSVPFPFVVFSHLPSYESLNACSHTTRRVKELV